MLVLSLSYVKCQVTDAAVRYFAGVAYRQAANASAWIAMPLHVCEQLTAVVVCCQSTDNSVYDLKESLWN